MTHAGIRSAHPTMPANDLATASRLPSTRSMPRPGPLAKAAPTDPQQNKPAVSPGAHEAIPVGDGGIGLDLQQYADLLQQHPEHGAPLQLEPVFTACIDQPLPPPQVPQAPPPVNLQEHPELLQSYAAQLGYGPFASPTEPVQPASPVPPAPHSPGSGETPPPAQPPAQPPEPADPLPAPRPGDGARRQHKKWLPKPAHRVLQAFQYVKDQLHMRVRAPRKTQATPQDTPPKPTAAELKWAPDGRLQRTQQALEDYVEGHLHRFVDALERCPGDQAKDLIQGCWDFINRRPATHGAGSKESDKTTDLFFKGFPLLVRAAEMTGRDDLQHMLTERVIANLKNQKNFHATHGRSGTTVFSGKRDHLWDFLVSVGALLEGQNLSSHGIYSNRDWLKALLPRADRDAFDDAVDGFGR